ncbi:MAG: YtxH domain-containing protein [Candidatus Humimicrobiia bacterium]
MKNKKDKKFELITSFAIGFCVGVLIAPRTGEETRKILSEIGKQYIQKSSDWLNEKIAQFSEITDQYAENIKEYLEDIK